MKIRIEFEIPDEVARREIPLLWDGIRYKIEEQIDRPPSSLHCTRSRRRNQGLPG